MNNQTNTETKPAATRFVDMTASSPLARYRRHQRRRAIALWAFGLAVALSGALIIIHRFHP